MEEKLLKDLYLKNKLSMKQIADRCGCSVNKVSYWFKKYNIKTRTISEAIYSLNNPNGNPFKFHRPTTMEEAILFGVGVGLYWGEGTKKDKCTVKLGNSDPALINKFILFLEKVFSIDRKRLKFSLLIFNDHDPKEILGYWSKKINISTNQFYKSTIIKLNRKGTYRSKSEHGVIILYFHNKKLRDKLVSLLPT